MKKELHLEDLELYLDETYIYLDLVFLNKFLINASKDSSPASNRMFIEKIGLVFNTKINKSMGLYQTLRGVRPLRFSILRKIKIYSTFSWLEIEQNIFGIKVKRGQVTHIKFPFKIGKDLGCIVGHILGDGSIDKRSDYLFFSNKNKDLLQEFYSSMDRLFAIEPRIWLQESGNFITQNKWIKRVQSIDEVPSDQNAALFYPKICVLLIKAMLGNFAEGKNKKITSEILSAPKEFQIGLLRAFCDSDGTIDKTHGPRLFQDDKKILQDFSIILSQLGIQASSIHFYIKKEKMRYYIDITNKQNYRRFYEIIGCTSKNKAKTLKKLVEASYIYGNITLINPRPR